MILCSHNVEIKKNLYTINNIKAKLWDALDLVTYAVGNSSDSCEIYNHDSAISCNYNMNDECMIFRRQIM